MRDQLHVVLLPFFAPGHMIPTLDIARLLAARDVKATIITTPANAPVFTKATETANSLIQLEIIQFPTREASLPDGCENAESVMSKPELVPRFFRAADLFQEKIEPLLDRVRPQCLIADMIYTWANESAAKFNIPRLGFHGMSYFALCAQEIVRVYEPYRSVSSNDDPFVLPGIPHEIGLLRTQINPELMDDKDKSMWNRMESIKKSEVQSYGVLVNSFRELEPEYANCFQEMGRKTWSIGPVSLCNQTVLDKSHRGKPASIDRHNCLTWLDSKNPDSVIYVCFGSMVLSISPQLDEIAIALESSGKNFVWAIRDGEEWLSIGGFEERTKEKGLVIRGWAPQVMILEHEAVGAFMTHCGWNSTLEGISAGVPMVTWPTFADQFYNDKLVTRVLRIGVSVGVKKWSRVPSVEDVICRNNIEKAIREIMEGHKAVEMRRRAKMFKEMASKAVAEGGSSYSDLSSLITELKGLSYTCAASSG